MTSWKKKILETSGVVAYNFLKGFLTDPFSPTCPICQVEEEEEEEKIKKKDFEECETAKEFRNNL